VRPVLREQEANSGRCCPILTQDLIYGIQLGLARDRVPRENAKPLGALREQFGSLSPREREIVIQVARGRLRNRSPAILASQSRP
jgi:FixJ family two-component response regulator